MLAAVVDKTAVFPEPKHCSVCGIFIFSSQAEAAGFGIVFYAHINGRVGNKCMGCANGDLFIGAVEEKKSEKS